MAVALPVLLVFVVALHTPTVVGMVASPGQVITGIGRRTVQGPATTPLNSGC